MLRFPNCKINLGLYITNKRADGYHDLETVFYPLRLKDVLEIVPAKKDTSILITGKTMEGDDKSNLVWKAYELMKKNFPEQVPALDIYLHKIIPMGAGLGGGSADGAFMLHMINDFCKLQVSEEQLAIYALQLGSDCPFFIYNTPQFATGRGEKLESIELDLSNYSIQLICPTLHISTAKAFGKLTPKPADFDLRNIASFPVSEWRERIRNDFEKAVFDEYPELQNIKLQLYEQGAVYASMSGSGSAIFGIFRKEDRASIQSSLFFEEYYV
ncbi:MAG TPA: 4-(cytidine 5'-diphospho)-2-C-methyl-D-erythritol kinase [Flavipsychrobacter sp.]|nr:4-(cytidine 5'-diphospho)-2-C-methyl-D-erythritol kinase [Flavipsychrobacter sp.]